MQFSKHRLIYTGLNQGLLTQFYYFGLYILNLS